MAGASSIGHTDFTEADYDTDRLATLVSHLDSGEFGDFLDKLAAKFGFDSGKGFLSAVKVGREGGAFVDLLAGVERVS